jgi:eukaryotic-like serine/threonine-protein kinase
MLGPFGDYTLVRELGAGGMAEVFLARCDRVVPGRPKTVVVKRVLPHLVRNRAVVDLFLNEARLISQIRSPHIARVFETGRVRGRDYICMEFIAGVDLARLIERCQATDTRTGQSAAAPPPGPTTVLGPGALVRLLVDICGGLTAAHTATGHDGAPLGLIHGDLTPRNVMIDFAGVAKLIDFGVAQARGAVCDDTPPDQSAIRGTYAYMAPEQIKGQAIDERSDVFAVGVLMWELFAGCRLFARQANFATLAAVVEQPAPPLFHLLPAHIGDKLDQVAQKALAKRPADRYPSCDRLADDLLRVAFDLQWDTAPTGLAEAFRALFSRERRQLEDTVNRSGHHTVDDWLFALASDVDLSWMAGK